MTEAWLRVEDKIQRACDRAGRARTDVQLVVVSKTKPAALVREAWNLGLRSFGENYVQEALSKQQELADLAIDWHFIGHLQSNKAKDVVGKFSLIHSLSTLSAAKELAKRSYAANLRQKVLIEINVAGEASKSGVRFEEADEFLGQVSVLLGIEVCGVMSMPPPSQTESVQRRHFAQVRAWGERYSLKLYSMGTSDDFEWAILEGATHIRLGRTLLGERY